MEKLGVLESRYGKLTLVRSLYRTGGVEYSLVNERASPVVTLSVNLPGVKLEPGEVCIKTWSENEEISRLVLEQGWFRDTGKRVPTGYAEAAVWLYAKTHASALD